jgi:hypothetical protein
VLALQPGRFSPFRAHYSLQVWPTSPDSCTRTAAGGSSWPLLAPNLGRNARQLKSTLCVTTFLWLRMVRTDHGTSGEPCARMLRHPSALFAFSCRHDMGIQQHLQSFICAPHGTDACCYYSTSGGGTKHERVIRSSTVLTRHILRVFTLDYGNPAIFPKQRWLGTGSP